ncbi:MAG: tetratricopeptide repeat protein, partial [Thermoguttaceae bacterium]
MNKTQKEFFQEAIDIARTISDEQSRIETLRYIATKLAESKMWEEAEKIRAELPPCEKDDQVCSELNYIICLVNNNRATEAIQIAKTMCDTLDHTHALATIAEVLFREGECERAEEIFDEVIRDTESNDPYGDCITNIAGILIELGRFDKAEALAERIEDPNSRMDIFRSIARVRMIQDGPENAKPYLEKAVIAAREFDK